MAMQPILYRAITIATKVHKGQHRWGGEPYITHPLAVMDSLETELEKVCGVLHDTLEDTDLTLYEVQEEFGPEVAGIVDLLTQKDGQSYAAYIQALVRSENATAIKVKLADLQHNMSDLRQGSMKDKYELAQFILEDVLTELNITWIEKNWWG